MSKFRLISFVHHKSTLYRIERRVLFFFWIDLGNRDFDDVSDARERFIQVVANRGLKVVLAEM